jgi:hypothetical protein
MTKRETIPREYEALAATLLDWRRQLTTLQLLSESSSNRSWLLGVPLETSLGCEVGNKKQFGAAGQRIL